MKGTLRIAAFLDISMCGRFTLLASLSEVIAAFHIEDVAGAYLPGANIAPGHEVTAVIRDGVNRLVSFRWGLVPFWAKNPSVGPRLFNARAETVAEKPSFRNAFRKRRCLVVADGFYEWRTLGNRKTPFRFSLASGAPFGFAGLYERWTSPDHSPVHSCTIITTEPNELVRTVHDRMPVILPRDRESLWIHPGEPDGLTLESLLTPYPAKDMRMEAASV